MPISDPSADFQDDGGTSAWRANRATWGPVIDAEPISSRTHLPQQVRRRGFRARWRKLTFIQAALIVLFTGGVLPWIIVFGGILCLAAWDATLGRLF